MAKLENGMTTLTQPNKVQWGKSPSKYQWEARIFADVDSTVIEAGKRIVDHCSPQRYGPNIVGGHSFLKREYLLNLLLFHYQDYGFFPHGHICITDEWLYERPSYLGKSKWFLFKSRSKGRVYEPGWWIRVPSQEEIEIKSSEYEPVNFDN